MGKLHVQKDDRVKVLSGKDRGKVGKILSAFPGERKVLVEGVNIVKKHQRPTQEMQQGGIIEKEAPINASNVMLICPRCEEPSRTGNEILDSGEKVRYCKKCEEIVD